MKIQTNFAIGKEKYKDLQSNFPYATAIIDPDWPYTPAPGVKNIFYTRGEGTLSGYTRYKGGENVYRQNIPFSIEELHDLPVGKYVGGYVFLWTTGPFLINGSAIHILKDGWGFEPASIITWAKWDSENSHGYGGVGYWFLGNAEFCIVGKRPGWPSIRTGRSSLIVAPKMGHSVKPDSIHELCETRFPGPYLELFGKKERSGWKVMGDEIDGKDLRSYLKLKSVA